MRCFQIITTLVTLCIPLPSNQHFIFPVSMCLLADICNHTWIPECARERNDSNLRLFIDECDMFEVNCDEEKNYEKVEYAECFKVTCPTAPPCPSQSPCPNHRFHRMGHQDGRRMAQTPTTTPKISLPYHMLHGKRRYTPIPRIRREKMKKEARRKMQAKAKPISKIQNTKPSKVVHETKILRRQSFVSNGKIFMRIFKAYVTKPKAVTKSIKLNPTSNCLKKCTKNLGFLEK